MKKAELLLYAMLLLMPLSCSINIMEYSILGHQKLTIKSPNGIAVSGYANAWFKSQRKAVEEATQNALKQAGKDYDVLINGTIEAEHKLLYIKFRVSGTAYKSSDLINTYGHVGFENWKKAQGAITTTTL